MFHMFYGLNMRKIGMTGFVTDGFGCNADRPSGPKNDCSLGRWFLIVIQR